MRDLKVRGFYAAKKLKASTGRLVTAHDELRAEERDGQYLATGEGQWRREADLVFSRALIIRSINFLVSITFTPPRVIFQNVN